MKRGGLLVVLLAACRVPPLDPVLVTIGADGDRFTRVCAVVRTLYPRLELVDADARRVQSAWTNVPDRGRVGRRRATVYWHDDSRLALLVEVCWLHLALDGTPYWTRAAVDRDGEQELVDALRAAFAALPADR